MNTTFHTISNRDAFGWWDHYAAKGEDPVVDLTRLAAPARTRCRACGEPLVKGIATLVFYQEVGSSAWRGPSRCYIHERPCIERKAA
jgi:hypothetical protein